MQVATAIAEILKREGVEVIFGYPVNPILEEAAKVGLVSRAVDPADLEARRTPAMPSVGVPASKV